MMRSENACIVRYAIERGLEEVAFGRTIDAKTVIEGLRRIASGAPKTEPR
jgi:hypothetical protein